MKYLPNFILTIVLAILFNMILPWWSIMLAAFVTGFILSLQKSAVFFVPFLAAMLLWMIYGYTISAANDFTLSTKIANLLPLGGNVIFLTLITGIIGGLAAGVAAISGKQLRLLLSKD